MKILAVSDQIIDRLYSASLRETYPNIDLLVSCGDLPYSYLEFLVSLYNIPLIYVPGNHDPEYGPGSRSRAEGGDNLDGEIRAIKGLLVAGLGGSALYQPGGPNQYTQEEVYFRVYRLLPGLLWERFLHRRRLDLLVTHSPPAGIHDDDDPAHRGLSALNHLVRVARPRYMLHGHTMFYRQNLQNHVTEYYGCQIVNIYPFRILEIDAPAAKP
jgi:Icc-related predicted phosphoesterase